MQQFESLLVKSHNLYESPKKKNQLSFFFVYSITKPTCFFSQYHYFSYGEFDVGRDLLKRSADMGHQESIYMLGMMLFFEETTKPEAIDLWKKIKSTEMDKCRWRAKKILRNMWINHRFCLQDPPCMTSLCRNGGKIGLPSREEWSRCEEDWFCSETCKWTYEFNSFCKVFH